MAYDDNHPDNDPEPTWNELRAFEDQSRAAHKVGCRYCKAKPGQPCINKTLGRPSRKIIAHTIRIADAETVRPLHTTPDEELPF